MALLDEELSQSMTSDDETMTSDEERQHQHQSKSSIIDPWDDLASRYEKARRKRPRRNFSLRTLEIYDDLHSKNGPEAVWKADEWPLRLNFSWLDHKVADSCSLVRGSESTV